MSVFTLKLLKSYSHINSHVRIISYVFFSSGTNRHKKELFVMDVRTPSGKTFPGNFSIIPSAKKWVNHSEDALMSSIEESNNKESPTSIV